MTTRYFNAKQAGIFLHYYCLKNRRFIKTIKNENIKCERAELKVQWPIVLISSYEDNENQDSAILLCNMETGFICRKFKFDHINIDFQGM